MVTADDPADQDGDVRSSRVGGRAGRRSLQEPLCNGAFDSVWLGECRQSGVLAERPSAAMFVVYRYWQAPTTSRGTCHARRELNVGLILSVD